MKQNLDTPLSLLLTLREDGLADEIASMTCLEEGMEVNLIDGSIRMYSPCSIGGESTWMSILKEEYESERMSKNEDCSAEIKPVFSQRYESR